MAKQSLAIKYRPSSFDDVTEQDNVKIILTQQLNSGEIKHSYLFVGGAGTGKTTCARILANEINKNVGNPIELDAASNNSVDDMRELIKQAQTKSIDSEYKVFIVDECHMITVQGWNALLKILEEPPAKSIFIFCTTDPQKVPKTILSRVQRYDFRMISQQGIVDRLKYVLGSEKNGTNYEWEPDAIRYIAKLTNGHMRDALTMLDKCLTYNNNLTLDNVVKALGVADYDTMMRLTDCISKDNAKTLEIIDTVYMSGVDLKQFIKQYMEFIFEIIKYDIVKDIDKTQLPNISEIKKWLENVKDCHKILDILVELNKELKYSMSPKFLVEYMLTEGMNE